MYVVKWKFFWSVEYATAYAYHLACSKRSDSGERCEVKKEMKSRGRLRREVHLSPSLAFIFCAPFYFASFPTIWTPGTGYLSFKCQHPSPYNSNSQTKEVPHDFYNNSKRHYRKYWSVASFLMTTPKHFLSSTTWHCGTHSLVSLDFSRLLQMESLLVGYGAQCTVQ